MGKCCKKSKSASKSSDAVAAGTKAVETAPGGSSLSMFRGASLGEATLAAGILVFLPVVLNKVAPNVMRSIKNGFELAAKR